MAAASVSAASDDIASDDAIQSSIDDNAINEVTLETDDSVSDSIDDIIQSDVDSSDDKSLGASPLKDGEKTIYVSTTGDDSHGGYSHGGLSEEDAVATISKAYELSGDGDTINIAAGTYDQSSSITLNKSTTFNGAEGTVINRAGSANVFTYIEDAPITVTLNNLIFTATSTASNPVINIGGGATLWSFKILWKCYC